MTAEIGLVYHRCSDHQWLQRLREWIDKDPLPNKLGIEAPQVEPWDSPDDALDWRAQLPSERLVVTFGYSRGEIETYQKFGISSGEPIIVGDPGAASTDSNASASFLNGEKIVTCR